MYINLLQQSYGTFSGQVNQSVKCVHSCLRLTILIKISTNNPSQKSEVIDY